MKFGSCARLTVAVVSWNAGVGLVHAAQTAFAESEAVATTIATAVEVAALVPGVPSNTTSPDGAFTFVVGVSALPADALDGVASRRSFGRLAAAAARSSFTATPGTERDNPVAAGGAGPETSSTIASTAAGLIAAVPEPGVAALFAFGFAAMAWVTRRRDRAAAEASEQPAGGDPAAAPPAADS